MIILRKGDTLQVELEVYTTDNILVNLAGYQVRAVLKKEIISETALVDLSLNVSNPGDSVTDVNGNSLKVVKYEDVLSLIQITIVPDMFADYEPGDDFYLGCKISPDGTNWTTVFISQVFLDKNV